MQVAYNYPTSAELFAIEQDLMPRLEEGRVGLQLFPRVTKDASKVMWEQRDNFIGLQQIRGLNGQPPSVKKTGMKRFDMRPGFYGEFELIDEEDLTERRQLGEFGLPVTIDDLVGVAQTKLLQRELDRCELIIWTLLVTGTFSVSSSSGILHTDTFPIKTFTTSTTWLSNLTTAVPLQDIRTVQLNQRGQSARYDSSAKMYMNLKTANGLLNNSNAADIGAKFRLQYGRTIENLGDINTILKSNDLPEIIVYDQGYYPEPAGSAFTTFIPDSKVVVVGTRPMGQTVGEYQMTRNANNPDLGPGAYTIVIDRVDMKIPRTIEVHRGHNGGPAIYYPGAITVMNV